MGQLTSPPLDPAQRDGHHRPGRALLLSAAAGSGKTAVLTEGGRWGPVIARKTTRCPPSSC